MFTFCLENIRSVYNVGSIFRTGEGFGFNDFILIGITPTPLDKKGIKRKDFIKTALGAEDRIKWQHFENLKEVLEKYEGYKIVSLEMNSNSTDIDNLRTEINSDLEINPEQKYLVFLGSEVDGVSKEILDISDHIYHIPMSGEKESFNVSVATGILMYLLKQITE